MIMTDACRHDLMYTRLWPRVTSC